MRINTNKINKVFENLGQKNQIEGFLKQRDKEEEVIYLIPFFLDDLGTINTTEAGMVGNEFEIDSFTSYAKLITGLNNIIAKWDGAYNVYIDEEAIKDLPDMEKYITKEYKVGRTIKCNSYASTSGSNVIPSPVDTNFKQIEINEVITLETNERLNVSDILKVYLIPQKGKWRWLYLSDLTEYFDNENKYIRATITLRAVNSLYSQSGGAIEQFIQKGAPGEGYAFPKWNAETKQIELDEERAKDLPIQAVQREYSGAATPNTLICYGRPTIQKEIDGVIQNTFNPKIKASRLLLPYAIQTPRISAINTKPSAEVDYYLATEAKPTMNKYYGNWKEQFQSNYDLQMRKQYEGVLELPKESDLEITNPIDAGTHRYILWDENFQISIKKEFDTKTNKLCGDKINLDGDFTIPQILAHNYFITNHLITLPMNAQTNTTWNLRDIPLIGGFLNTITLGIPIGWTNTKARVQMGTIMLLTPANLVKYGNQLLAGSENSLIPFDLLQENTSDLIEHSGIAGMGSSIKVLLTDEFEKDGKRYNTLQLGQKLPNGEILKWDGKCKPIAPTNTDGYVIDTLIDRTISKTNCRTVFFSSAYEVFQSTYKTKSKFTGEIRDWTNEIRFSNWKASSGTIKFPEIIQQPNPPDVVSPILEINDIKEVFTYKGLANAMLENNFFSKLTSADWVNPKQRLFKNIVQEFNRNLATENFNDGHYLNDYILKEWEFDYTQQAPNINQLAIQYDKIVCEMFQNRREIRVSELVGGVREFVWFSGQSAKINYKIQYDLPNGERNKLFDRYCEYKFKVKLRIDALSSRGKIKFTFLITNQAVFPLVGDREQQIVFALKGGSGVNEIVKPMGSANADRYFSYDEIFRLKKREATAIIDGNQSITKNAVNTFLLDIIINGRSIFILPKQK